MEYLKQIVCVLVLAVFVGTIQGDSAATTDPPTTTPDSDYDGPMKPSSYAFSFETKNGQMRDEKIQLTPDTTNASHTKMEAKFKGSYSFISADGYEYVVYYKADKKGFRPYVTAHKIITDKDTTV